MGKYDYISTDLESSNNPKDLFLNCLMLENDQLVKAKFENSENLNHKYDQLDNQYELK